MRVKHWMATNPTTPVISCEFAAKDHLRSDSATFDFQGHLHKQRGQPNKK